VKVAAALIEFVIVPAWFSAAAAAQPRYAVTPLCPEESEIPPVTFATNSAGQIAGTCSTPSAGQRAFVYSAGALNYLTPDGSLQTVAGGINAGEQVLVTTIFGPNVGHTFLFSNGAYTDLTQQSTSDPNGPLTYAAAISDSGQIVGTGHTAFPNNRALLLSNGSLTDLGTLGGSVASALAINNAGQIVGSAAIDQLSSAGTGHVHAFLYDGTLHDLGTIGGIDSRAVAINDKGQAVGTYFTGTSDHPIAHAFLYDHGSLTPLGSLGGQESEALAINNLGQVVGDTGTGAFLFDHGTLEDLNAMIDPTLHISLDRAAAIDDAGTIVATGYLNAGTRQQQYQAFLLTPVPEPASLLIGTLAGAGLVAPRRRQR